MSDAEGADDVSPGTGVGSAGNASAGGEGGAPGSGSIAVMSGALALSPEGDAGEADEFPGAGTLGWAEVSGAGVGGRADAAGTGGAAGVAGVNRLVGVGKGSNSGFTDAAGFTAFAFALSFGLEDAGADASPADEAPGKAGSGGSADEIMPGPDADGDGGFDTAGGLAAGGALPASEAEGIGGSGDELTEAELCEPEPAEGSGGSAGALEASGNFKSEISGVPGFADEGTAALETEGNGG